MLSILNLLVLPILGIGFILCVRLGVLFLGFFPSKASTTTVNLPTFFFRLKLDQVLKGVALYVTSANLIFSAYFVYFFKEHFFGFQYVVDFPLLGNILRFGVDGISLGFIFLTVFLIPICILLSWDYINQGSWLFLIAFLSLEVALLIFFSTLNILVLYISFESTLIPMFIIIGLWGGVRKIKAAYYFFMFTLLGSVFLLLGLLLLWTQTFSFDFVNLLSYKFAPLLETTLWVLFFIGFLVKIPIFPFHLWLPEAHVEAPTAGSVLLAGLLLKLGGYGFIRICLTFFPQATFLVSSYAALFSILSVLFASFAAIVQVDLKKLVAYSSIAHMNFGLLGLFTNTKVGIDGCVLSMLSHGFVSSALFITVDIIYRRFGTRLIAYYAGLALVMPKYCFFLSFLCFSNIGFPGTSSFIGELLVFASLPLWNGFVALLAGTTVVWSSLYSLLLFVKVAFGNYKPFGKLRVVFYDLVDLEFYILALLSISSLCLGLYPEIILAKLDCATTFVCEYSKFRYC